MRHTLSSPTSRVRPIALLPIFWCLICINQALCNPLIPDVHGFGVQTQAGLDGRVIRVANLNSSGVGSLRAAIDTNEPRVIVFEVGGVIDLQKSTLRISNPHLTIAGQTAPSPGITIIKGGISITTHDVLIQHIRVRPGDAGEEKRSGWSPDGIGTSGAYNVVIDHCSTSWAVDENLSVSGPRTEGPEATSHDVTVSNCIIAEGLDDSTHEKGPHSKGTLIHDYCRNIAILNNLYAHNVERNPYFKAFTSGVVVNNLIYNPERHAIKMNYVDSEWDNTSITPQPGEIAVIGNVFIYGRNTHADVALIGENGKAYLKDNIALHRRGNSVDITKGDIEQLQNPPVWPDNLSPKLADTVEADILKNVGARPNDRDEVDQRIIREFEIRKGRIIDSQDEVGGYPNPTMTQRKLDVPEENLVEWLNQFSKQLENQIETKVQKHYE